MTLSIKIKTDNKHYDTQHTHKNITIGRMTGRMIIKSDNQQNTRRINIAVTVSSMTLSIKFQMLYLA
jgi:hypothetical protein